MENFTCKIEEFEGPLDLLLHLISRHKMELFDIRIYELIDQYLAFIGDVGPETLEPTSEFIEMAARLVHMKSTALLPRQDEAEELARELTGQLIEYHLCKQAASRLRDMSEGIHFFVREPLVVEFAKDYAAKHDPSTLLLAYMDIMGRGARVQPPDTGRFDPIVTAPIVSVSSRIVHILRGLKKGTVQKLSDLFGNTTGRSESVAMFLGVLELIKAKRIRLDDEGNITAEVRRREGAR